MKNTIKKIIGEKGISIVGIRKREIKTVVARLLRSVSGHTDETQKIQARIFFHPSRDVFFGYYDITPFDHSGRKLLAMHAVPKRKTPSAEDEISIGYYELEEKKPFFTPIGVSTTWCWQQGCRLQWLPGSDTDHVVFNRVVKGKYGAVVTNIHTRQTAKRYTRPLYAVSPDGKWGLSVNFSRLQRLRPGYGYNTFEDDSKTDFIPSMTAYGGLIWKADRISFFFL
jgi:hypothetical protein